MTEAGAAPPRRSAGAAPLRVAGSARRTSTVDISWPEGRAGNMLLVGRARDIVTPRVEGPALVCAEDALQASLRPDRVIASIAASPARPALSNLVGERGGGGFRQALERVVPEERRTATPLYLLLDDISGASLVAGWAWSQWDPDWLSNARAALKDFDLEKAFRSRVGICSGFAQDSSAFAPGTDRSGTPTSDLRHPDDPEGWHTFSAQEGIGLRRARRIDVWLDQTIVIDSAFQDSATVPPGTVLPGTISLDSMSPDTAPSASRSVVHEYRLRATADPDSFDILSVEAEPRVLPFAECTAAAANVSRLVGVPLRDLRERVLAELRGTAGCTHLNDALRALAEVPALMAHLSSLI